MKIAIWGMGVSGISALRYLAQKTSHDIYVINQSLPETWECLEQALNYVDRKHCLSQAESSIIARDIDLIVLSPGIDPRIKELQAFTHVPKICEVELALREINTPLIAVTGTNGKTTTVTMIAKALEMSGKKVYLGGNIGKPLCDIFFEKQFFDYIVLELSSFQLELIESLSPEVAVILNISESHMERYIRIEDYISAKLRIADHLKEDQLLLLDRDYPQLTSVKGEIQFITKNEEYDFSKSSLVGEHYKLTIDVLEKIFMHLKIQHRQQLLQKLIETFSGVKYRLEFIKQIGKTKFYNDGKSTNTASTLSALASFPQKKLALIMGGKLRDESQDLSGLKNFKFDLYTFGEASSFIKQNLEYDFKVVKYENLESLLSKLDYSAYEVVLFSPAYPSFDQYRNYIERSQHFENLVSYLV